MLEIFRALGVFYKYENNTLEIYPDTIKNFSAPYEIVRKMRASYYILGPLLAKYGRCKLSLPGGCVIGSRPIDLHIKGFNLMGADIKIEHGFIEAHTRKLKGTEIYLEGPKGPSVGATINVLMAAVLAEGTTIIEGAAQEPEVEVIIDFLNTAGAKIKGKHSSKLIIDGVKTLKGIEFKNIYDRIEAGTMILAFAITNGKGKLTNVPLKDLRSVFEIFKNAGIKINKIDETTITVEKEAKGNPVQISTSPFPGFPTDLQAQFMAFLTLVPGTSVIIERVFENRFIQAMELIRMGANIVLNKDTAIITGVNKLSGTQVMASDLRASASLVLAALAAEGKTIIHRIYHLDRGYEKIENKLKKVGAWIERVS